MDRRLVILGLSISLVMSASARAEPVSTKAAAAPVTATVVQLKRRNAGTFYVPSVIDGFGAANLLVDTGSSHLVISQEMLDTLAKQDRAIYVRDLRGVMADGSARVVPVYRIASLRLGSGCWIHDVEAAVFPKKSRPILGMSILGQLAPFTLSTDPATLSLSRCQAAPKAVVAQRGGSGAEMAALP